MDSISIDLETLSTRSTAIITSIGAVKFNSKTGEVDPGHFQTSVTFDDQFNMGRHVSESTLVWWAGQSNLTAEFTQAKYSLHDSLLALKAWAGGPFNWWANGPAFDIAILDSAYSQIGVAAPWKHWEVRCYRTVKSFAIDPVKIQNPDAHNALSDAITQALQIHEFIKAL